MIEGFNSISTMEWLGPKAKIMHMAEFKSELDKSPDWFQHKLTTTMNRAVKHLLLLGAE